MASSIPVAIASNQSAVPVSGTVTSNAGTGNFNNAAVGATGSAVPASGEFQGGLASTALPTAATAGNLTGNMVDKFGRQVVLPQAPRDLVGEASITITSSTAPATLIASGGAGVFTDITDITIVNISATGTEVDISDGTNTYYFYAPPTDMRGISLTVPHPATSAATAWTATTLTSVASVKISVKYIKNK
jgi:hypothetical protein